jgi:RNA polymerase sigma factor (sigma-70 family)
MTQRNREPVVPDPFGSTRWSTVLAAAGDGTDARSALERLCERYWPPVYGFVRSRMSNTDDAYDLTQEFFAQLLEKKTFTFADPTRGRFRAFLLTAVKNFLVTQHSRQTALKRGGGRTIATLDRDVAESRLPGLHATTRTPEQEFERSWALAILDHVLERLRVEQTAAGPAAEFSALLPILTGQSETTIQSTAAGALGKSPEAIRAAVYRLRKRYRALLRDEIAQTVGAAEDVAEELQHLVQVVSF